MDSAGVLSDTPIILSASYNVKCGLLFAGTVINVAEVFPYWPMAGHPAQFPSTFLNYACLTTKDTHTLTHILVSVYINFFPASK